MTLFWLFLTVLLVILLGVLNKKSELQGILLALISVLVLGSQVLFFNWERFDFFFYFAQSLLVIYAMISYTQGAWQRYFGSLLLGALAFFFLAKDTIGLEYEQELHLVVWVSLTYALVPVLLYRPKLNLERGLEKTMVIHQFFLQSQFLIWCYQNSVNIKHYGLFDHFILSVGILAVVILFMGFILRKSILWSHLFLTLSTFLLIVCSLEGSRQGITILSVWVFSQLFLRLLPKDFNQDKQITVDILNRLDIGALGGSIFWSQIYLVIVFMSGSLIGSVLWPTLIAISGSWIWVLNLATRSTPETEINNRKQEWQLSLWVASQVAIPIILYWLPKVIGDHA